MNFEHIPVLMTEVLHWLNPKPGKLIVDGTVGGGGHSAAVLERLEPGGRLIGIDRDPAALRAATNSLSAVSDSFDLQQANFRNMPDVLQRLGVAGVDGVLLDLGVSSHQLDVPDRGFSYQEDAPLDMRMNPTQKISAQDIVNHWSQQKLQQIISDYGEERWSARIAEFIVREREASPIETTGQLVAVIKAAIPAGARRQGPHPARRTFQALRIAVNEELESLEDGLKSAVDVLNPGGRLCVISFHSLEDRIVKHTFRHFERDCICPPGLPVCRCDKEQVLRVLTRSPITASDEEREHNPRARSAKLRAAERV